MCKYHIQDEISEVDTTRNIVLNRVFAHLAFYTTSHHE